MGSYKGGSPLCETFGMMAWLLWELAMLGGATVASQSCRMADREYGVMPARQSRRKSLSEQPRRQPFLPYKSAPLSLQCPYRQPRIVGDDAVDAEVGKPAHQGCFIDCPDRDMQTLFLGL